MPAQSNRRVDFPSTSLMLGRWGRFASAWFVWALASALVVGCGPSDPAQFPHKQLKIICPWATGGGTDRVSRYWAGALEEKLGRACVVVNRTGGGGSIGHREGARAKADGHTLTTITFELSTMHHMGISDLTYEDYTPLLQFNADAAAIIVQNDAPWKNLEEFLAEAEKEPGKLKMSGTAVGGAWDLARAALLHSAELPTNAIAWIPKNGAAPSLQELLGGHIDGVCCSVPEAAAQIEGGQLRVLAVMADERLDDYPDLPTCKEQGVDCVVYGWRGLAVPKETPVEVVEQLKTACREIAESDAFQEYMSVNKFGRAVRVGDEFTEFLKQQDSQWKDVIQAAGYDQQ